MRGSDWIANRGVRKFGLSHGGSRTGRDESILQSRILGSSVENGQVVAVWEKCC